MLFNALLLLSAIASAAAVNGPPEPFTVTRVFHTITDVAPFIVDATTTTVFTPSPSTVIAFPTGPGPA